MNVLGGVGYLVSLPERLVRAVAAGLGGLLYEASALLLPGWFHRTRLYRVLAANALRVAVELVGGVEGVLPASEVTAEELALRKAAGTGLEMAGLLLVGWSPLWLLAAAADLSGGTRAYLQALVAELRHGGLLSDHADVESVAELLQALETSSAVLAETLDVPPLTVPDLRRSWQALRANAAALPGPARLARIYALLREVASQEGRPLGAVSAAVAVGAARAGMQIGQVYLFDYYQQALGTIAAEGLRAYLQRVMRPYRSAVAGHLDPKRSTHTQRLLVRCTSRARRTFRRERNRHDQDGELPGGAARPG